jgi:hypothetical protein
MFRCVAGVLAGDVVCLDVTGGGHLISTDLTGSLDVIVQTSGSDPTGRRGYQIVLTDPQDVRNFLSSKQV